MPVMLGQFVILAVVLIAGFLLGFASRPSTRKWRDRIRDQSDRFTVYRDDAEDRIRAAQQRARSLEAETDALRTDHWEAEHMIARLKTAPPAPVEPVADVMPPEPEAALAAASGDVMPAAAIADDEAVHPVASVPVDDTPASVSAADDHVPAADQPLSMTPTPSAGTPAPIGPAEPDMPAKGWFGGSTRDDLTRIRGIDGPLNTRLFGLGVVRFEDVEKFSAEDEMALEQRLALPVGIVARDQWRTQAALLRAGKDDEHAAHFGDEESAPVA